MSYFTHEDPINKSENFKIRQIPHLVAPLKISQLNFSHNQIRSIPPHINAACNLQILDLSHNKISKVEHIFNITSLKFINLSHNLISELPPQIVNLVQIENVDLSFNKIKIMSSIKVLKNLFQMRMLQYKGFLEINLQGNEVLKKKGCKELYQKWKSPTLEEFSSLKKMINESISRTKKRNTKSIELPFRQKEIELIQTNRTFLMPQSSKLINSFKATEGASIFRNNELASKPHQMTQKLKGIPFTSQSEQLKANKELNSMSFKEMNSNEQISRLFNFKDMSILSQQNKDNNSLKEWFSICINQLNNLLQMFQLIVDNEDFNTMQTIIKQKMRGESRLVQELIKLTIEAINNQLHSDFQRIKQIHYAERVESLFQQIKVIHKDILNLLNQKQAHSIKLYKPWVVQYRKLKGLIASTSSKICTHKQNILRQKQIQQLVNISPEKTENIVISQPKDQIVRSSAKRKQIDKLNQLLFSRTNDEHLLLSEGKRSNSQKKTSRLDKEETECDNCLMSKWQVTKCKQEIAQLKEQLKLLSFQKQKQNKKIKELQIFKDKYLSLEAKQHLIIEELEVIQPSTYQNLMLQQAKTIEYMLSMEPMVQTDDISQFNRFRSKEIATTSICTEKHLTGMNTRLSSNKQEKISTHDWKNKVSEFTIQPKQQKSTEKEGRSSSYFKNKVITTINKTQKQSNQSNGNNGVSSNKYQIDQKDRNKVIVSQFNSQANSMNNSQKKEEDTRRQLISNNLSKGEILNNYENVAHKQSLQVKKQKTQSDIILISEHSESKHSISLKYSKKSSKIQEQSLLAKQRDIQNLMIKKLQKNSHSQNSFSRNKQNDSLVANKFGGKIDLRNTNKSKKRKQSNSTNKITKTNGLNQLNQVYKSAYQNKESQFFQNNKYKDHVYCPMESIQADSYKKYMQYHLRNNIIQILSKKGNLMPQNYEKKYLLLTKSQKLINKRAQTSRQFQKSASRQKSSREISSTTLR